jgi:hypothetical protein
LNADHDRREMRATNALGSSQHPDQVASTVAILNGVGQATRTDTTAAPVNAADSRSGSERRTEPIRGPGFFNVDEPVRTISVVDAVASARVESHESRHFANPGGDVSQCGRVRNHFVDGRRQRQARLAEVRV